MHPSSYSGSDVWLLSVEDAEKRYGQKVVLQVNSFELYRRDRLLIAGPNGSGKSTFLRILAGITLVSAGRLKRSATLNGLRVCFVPQVGGLYQNLTLIENVRALTHLLGATMPLDLADRWYIRELGLDGHLHAKGRELSGGYQKLAAVACALATGPQGLYLDEPLTGIDPERREILLNGLSRASVELDFLIVTGHSTKEFSPATRIVTLDHGKIC